MEDLINDQHLRRIERMFREADVHGAGGLDMKEFRDAMKKIMGEVDDEDVDIIFMKVDTDCDGRVDWDEYLNYMLLEYREKDSLQQQKRPLYFPKPLKIILTAHCEIVSLQFYPFQTRGGGKKRDQGERGGWAAGVKGGGAHAGRYLSISRSAVLSYWSDRFKLLRSVHIGRMAHTVGQPVWVTAMVYLSNLNLLAISSTGRDIEFYDISASKCDIVFSLSELKANVVVMNYWTDGTKSVFSVGNASGTVFIFVSFDVVQNGLFDSAAFRTGGGSYRVPVSALLRNSSSSFLCCRAPVHSDWVHQVQYIPELTAVLTCCEADHSAMVLTAVPHSHKRQIKTTCFHLQKGILCFDYSPELNIVVTGGFDRVVRCWNPYIPTKATAQMKGHSADITHIAVNGRDRKVISVSKDKNVRIWDLQDCTCIQNIRSRNISMGRLPISSTYYHRSSNTMVLASCLIGVLRGDEGDSSQPKAVTSSSHDQPLCAALYNPSFKQVVSGCHAGVVSVWDVLTGEKVMQFQTVPERPVEVTAMAFDPPKRRLITGSKDGTVRLWNFNNGALLRELPTVTEDEVTGLLYINERIYVSGWSKKVTWYLDAKEDDEMEYRVWNQYHSEDIYSMHHHGNKMLVTASYSGDIIVWNIDSGRALCRFNAEESALALMPARVMEQPCQVTQSGPGGLYAGEQDQQFEEDEDEDDQWLSSMADYLRTMSRSLESRVRRPSGARTAHCTGPPSAHTTQGPRGRVLVPATPFPSQTSRTTRPALLQRRKTHNSRTQISRTQINRSHNSRTINLDALDKPRFAVEKVLFLGTRERGPDTAVLLSSSADGCVYAWSVSQNTGLLGKFRAVCREGPVLCSICSMSTDSRDQILLTGDSDGYVTLWDIEQYCYRMRGAAGQERTANQDALRQERTANEDALRLPELIPHYCGVDGPRRLVDQEKEVSQGGAVSLAPPPLLGSWRCHLKAVVHLEYVERFRLVLTASLDCNIRLWTTDGRYIGTFGQGAWRVGDPSTVPRELPADLRTAGSCQTLNVPNEGTHPHWSCAKRNLENLPAQKRQQSAVSKFGEAAPLRELDPRELDPRELDPRELDPRELDPRELDPRELDPRELDPRELVPREVDPREVVPREVVPRELDPRELVPPVPRGAEHTDEQIQSTGTQWEEKGKQTSSILGKAYKQRVRHHLPRVALDHQEALSSREQRMYKDMPLRVFKDMPLYSLQSVSPPLLPELLRDSRQGAPEGAETHASQRRLTKRAPHARYLAALPRPAK